MSREFKKEDRKEYYDMLEQLAQQDVPEHALSIWSEYHATKKYSRQDIQQLLTQYHGDVIIFYPIVKHDNTVLANYLYHLNPLVLTLPLIKKRILDTVITWTLSGQCPNILEWLEIVTPESFVEAKKLLLTLQQKSIDCIQRDDLAGLEKLYNNLKLAHSVVFFNSLYAPDIFKIAITKAQQNNLSSLTYLTNFDISALRVILNDNTSVLDVLCSNARYRTLVGNILDDDKTLDALDEYEQKKLTTAYSTYDPKKLMIKDSTNSSPKLAVKRAKTDLFYPPKPVPTPTEQQFQINQALVLNQFLCKYI